MKENKYNLGLVSVSFRRHSPKEILEAVRASGLSCIEWGSDVHAPCRDIARLREIVALQKNMEFSARHTAHIFDWDKRQSKSWRIISMPQRYLARTFSVFGAE